MFQQIIALLIIIFFLSRLLWQKNKKQIQKNEFIFWLFFWLLAAIAILTLKWIDQVVANIGFSSTGIDLLLYIAVLILFYFVFKIRLRQGRQEKEITKIVKKIALKKE